jgi:hypothetical protein
LLLLGFGSVGSSVYLYFSFVDMKDGRKKRDIKEADVKGKLN